MARGRPAWVRRPARRTQGLFTRILLIVAESLRASCFPYSGDGRAAENGLVERAFDRETPVGVARAAGGHGRSVADHCPTSESCTRSAPTPVPSCSHPVRVPRPDSGLLTACRRGSVSVPVGRGREGESGYLYALRDPAASPPAAVVTPACQLTFFVELALWLSRPLEPVRPPRRKRATQPLTSYPPVWFSNEQKPPRGLAAG